MDFECLRCNALLRCNNSLSQLSCYGGTLKVTWHLSRGWARSSCISDNKFKQYSCNLKSWFGRFSQTLEHFQIPSSIPSNIFIKNMSVNMQPIPTRESQTDLVFKEYENVKCTLTLRSSQALQGSSQNSCQLWRL